MAGMNTVPYFVMETEKTLASDFSSENPFTVKTVHNVGVNIDCNNVTDNTGTFDIQHRMYKDVNNFTEWATLTLSTTPTLADGDATFLINLNQVPPGQIRVKYNAAGGTPDGDATIVLSAASVGGA